MTIENQQNPEPIPAPPPHPNDFEPWLARQQHREDEVGEWARFILADIERGCWPTTETLQTPPRRDPDGLGGRFDHRLFHGRELLSRLRYHLHAGPHRKSTEEVAEFTRVWHEWAHTYGAGWYPSWEDQLGRRW